MSPRHPTPVIGAHGRRETMDGREPFQVLQPGGIRWPMAGHQADYHTGSLAASALPHKSGDSAYISAPMQGHPQKCSGQSHAFAWTPTSSLTGPQGLPPPMPRNLPMICPPRPHSHQEVAQLQAPSDVYDHDVPVQQHTPSKLAEPETHEKFPKGITPETQHAFRASHGLGHPSAVEFMGHSEFVSLGAYCAVCRALQVLGLRKRAYPFDSVRSPIEGIIHCLDSEFEDFLTFTETKQEGTFKVFTGSRWGGSFWHHNPTAPESKEAFIRRALRLYGQGDVPDTKPRVFIRAINSTKELDSALRLKDALQRALPKAPCYLLLMIDMQAMAGPIRLSGPEYRNILFYQIHESLFQQHASGEDMMQACSEAYAEALAFGIKYWSQCLDSSTMIGTCCSLEQLSATLQPFSAGEPANKLFWPNKFMGQQLSLGGGLRMPKLLGDNLVAHVRVPDGIAPGNVFQAEVFGQIVPVKLPSDASCAGELLKLTLAAGVVSATVTTMGLTATATTAAAAAAVAMSSDPVAVASQLQSKGLPTRC